MSTQFRTDLEALIKTGHEGEPDSPDFLLSDYLAGCLETYDRKIEGQEHHGFYRRTPGSVENPPPAIQTG